MIKVTVGKIYDGVTTYSAGDTIPSLSKEDEDRLVNNGVAEYSEEEAEEEYEETPPLKLVPEGNVESVKKHILTLEDQELLNEMINEEKAGQKRKTLIEAIEKRIEELKKVEDDEDGTPAESDNDLKIDFNIDDVMPT